MLPVESLDAEDTLSSWLATALELDSPDAPLPRPLDRAAVIALLASVGARPEYQLC